MAYTICSLLCNVKNVLILRSDDVNKWTFAHLIDLQTFLLLLSHKACSLCGFPFAAALNLQVIYYVDLVTLTFDPSTAPVPGK